MVAYKIKRPVPTYYIPLSDKIEKQLDNEWKAGGTKMISAQQKCPECGAEMYFDKGDSYNDPWWSCPKGHGTFSREKLLKLGKGWHGEHKRHKEVALKGKAEGANNTRMAKSDQGLKYIVEAKRWFERTNGNTYHTVVVIDAQTRETVFRSGFTYGYDDQWKYTALMGLINKGLFDKKDLYNHELIRKMFYMRVEDVTRKKDLDL